MEKKPFFAKKIQSFKVPKIAFFQRGYPMLLIKNVFFFLELFSVKIRPDIMLVCEIEKKAFLALKKCNLSKSQKSYFSKAVNPCF